MSITRPRRWKHSGITIALALALVVSACSSVTRVQGGAGSALSPRGQALGDDAADLSTVPGDPAASSDGTGGATATPGRTGTAQGPIAGVDTATPGASGSSAEGICKGSVEVGISYSPDVGAAYAANGSAENASHNSISGEGVKRQLQIGVDYINKNGGLGGCQIKPVWFAFSTIGDWTSQTQAECAAFTQDHKVIAIIPTAPEMPLLWDCAAEKNVVVATDSAYGSTRGHTRATYQRLRGTLVMANDLVFDAWGFMPAAFKEAGYFDPGAKFAIVYSDTKDQAFVVNNVLKPAFAAIGHPALDTAAIPGLQGFQTFGDAQSQCQSHFLRFRSQGISHIMFTTPEGPFACENNAESQGYRPRYAYTTSSGPVIPLQPAEQQLRSIMLRWTLITTSGSKASGPSTGNASRDLCNKIYAGQPINVSLTSIYRYCDALFLLQAGYRRAPDMTNTGFVAGLESLGDTLLATEGLGNARFGTGKNWGAASYAMAAWNAEKRQFEFTTKPTPIPGA